LTTLRKQSRYSGSAYCSNNETVSKQVLRDWNDKNNSVAPVNGDQLQTRLRDLELSSRTDIVPSIFLAASPSSSNPTPTATRLQADLDAMNEAAHWAFCRLLLFSEYLREKQEEQKSSKQARDFENE
jgi:hypothetical protein